MKTLIINSITKQSEVREMTSEEETLHNELIEATKVSEDNSELKQQQRQEKKNIRQTKIKRFRSWWWWDKSINRSIDGNN